MGDKIRGGVSTKLGPRPSLPTRFRRSCTFPPGTKTCSHSPGQAPSVLAGLGGVSTGLGQICGTSFPALMSGTRKLCLRNKRQNPFNAGTETEHFVLSVLTRSSIITLRQITTLTIKTTLRKHWMCCSIVVRQSGSPCCFNVSCRGAFSVAYVKNLATWEACRQTATDAE
jgi:hypothetical protein